MRRILFIVNPASSGGRCKSTWKKLRSLWPNELDSEQVVFTTKQGHARQIATTAEGYDVLAAVGGDGTAGEVLSGIMDREESRDRPELAVVPAGTANDMAQLLGIRSIEDAVAAALEGVSGAYDLIRVDCAQDGRPAHRYAFVLSDVGFSAESFRMLRPWMKRLFGPTGAYVLCTALGIIRHRPPIMTARWDGKEFQKRMWTIIVANGERTAGGCLLVAPGARIDDGLLRVALMEARSKWTMMRLLPRLASGAYVEKSFVSYFPTKKIEVVSEPPAGLQIDGDIFGQTPATFTVCPGALRALSPKPTE